MSIHKIALASLRFPETPAQSVALAVGAIEKAGAADCDIVCFPECYVPGYRLLSKRVLAPNDEFLEQAWLRIQAAAARAKVAVILGTERIVDSVPRITALVVNRDGSVAGFQDKVQLDPSEEEKVYAPGSGRSLFDVDGLKFGVVICHEGWRYPETVRDAARQGAQIVFHPHYAESEPGSFVPTTFAQQGNTFHESAILCRAAENTVYFASVNCSSDDSPITSAIANPDGTLMCYQPYGQEGLLVADINTEQATGLLAKRYKPTAL